MCIPQFKKQILACAIAGALALFGLVGGIMEQTDVDTAGNDLQTAQTANFDKNINIVNFELGNV